MPVDPGKLPPPRAASKVRKICVGLAADGAGQAHHEGRNLRRIENDIAVRTSILSKRPLDFDETRRMNEDVLVGVPACIVDLEPRPLGGCTFRLRFSGLVIEDARKRCRDERNGAADLSVVLSALAPAAGSNSLVEVELAHAVKRSNAPAAQPEMTRACSSIVLYLNSCVIGIESLIESVSP